MGDRFAWYSQHCTTCFCLNEGQVERETGEYHMNLPVGCLTKDVCEKRVLREMGFKAIARPIEEAPE